MPVIMDADRMNRTLTRIAHEIVERNRGVDRHRGSILRANMRFPGAWPRDPVGAIGDVAGGAIITPAL